jgi:hypothetical protein
MPLEPALIMMRNALVGAGIKSRVRLVASGKVYSGMGLAKNIALGADWCNAARAFMFSIGCIQAERCHLGTCPTGITTQDKWRQRGLVVDVQAERAARFHKKTVESLADIVAAAGLTEPGELQPHHLGLRAGLCDVETMIERASFLPEGILVDAPEETLYAHWWAAADPDSFKPKADLVGLLSAGHPSHSNSWSRTRQARGDQG